MAWETDGWYGARGDDDVTPRSSPGEKTALWASRAASRHMGNTTVTLSHAERTAACQSIGGKRPSRRLVSCCVAHVADAVIEAQTRITQSHRGEKRHAE